VLELMASQDGGELPADGVRDLGQRFVEIGTDLLARATELDGGPTGPVIIGEGFFPHSNDFRWRR
jgi:hypothetical protein